MSSRCTKSPRGSSVETSSLHRATGSKPSSPNQATHQGVKAAAYRGQPHSGPGYPRGVDRSVRPHQRRSLRIAVLAPIAWRVPPVHYGPWEQFASLLTEGLVDRGHDVTLFATANSVTTAALASVVPHGWSEAPGLDAKVAECTHIAALFERAGEFDVIHNGFDFLPLTYSRLVETPVVTTIHGFSSPDDRPGLRAVRRPLRLRRHQRLRPPSRAQLRRDHPPRHRHRFVLAAPRTGPPPAVLRTHPPRQGDGRRHPGRAARGEAARDRRHHPGPGVLRPRGRPAPRRHPDVLRGPGRCSGPTVCSEARRPPAPHRLRRALRLQRR